MAVDILGLGTAVPPGAIDQTRAAEAVRAFYPRDDRLAGLLPGLYRRTRIARRHSVLLEGPPDAPQHGFFAPSAGPDDRGPTTAARMERYRRDALPLAREAAEAALRDAAIPASAVTHLVTVSCTGFDAPGVDARLIEALGLSADVERVHVGFMGCHGTLNALRVADGLSAAHPGAVTLVCAVELCSIHMQYAADADAAVANALFADGAGALVCGAASGDRRGWKFTGGAGRIVPGSADAMTWAIGDHGFTMTLSARVPALLAAHLRPWLEDWLGRRGLSPGSIESWGVHPGGTRIVDAVESALGLGPEALADSRAVLEAYGNMSSPTIVFILDRLRRRGAPRPCVALGFGPGLALEGALLT